MVDDTPDLGSLWSMLKTKNMLALIPFMIYESFLLAFNINICKHLAGYFFLLPDSTSPVKFSAKGQITRIYISLGFYGLGKLFATCIIRPIDRKKHVTALMLVNMASSIVAFTLFFGYNMMTHYNLVFTWAMTFSFGFQDGSNVLHLHNLLYFGFEDRKRA